MQAKLPLEEEPIVVKPKAATKTKAAPATKPAQEARPQAAAKAKPASAVKPKAKVTAKPAAETKPRTTGKAKSATETKPKTAAKAKTATVARPARKSRPPADAIVVRAADGTVSYLPREAVAPAKAQKAAPQEKEKRGASKSQKKN